MFTRRCVRRRCPKSTKPNSVCAHWAGAIKDVEVVLTTYQCGQVRQRYNSKVHINNDLRISMSEPRLQKMWVRTRPKGCAPSCPSRFRLLVRTEVSERIGQLTLAALLLFLPS